MTIELELCGVVAADTLHITSWDDDHCCASELEALLDLVRPRRIECPGYEPHTDNGERCWDIIYGYRRNRRSSNRAIAIQHITPEYIDGLQRAGRLAFEDIFYNPSAIDACCDNNNSTVKIFRRGSFNVLSLGDVESHEISASLRRRPILRRETDLMILAHRGADNGFTTKPFLSHLGPQLAICSSDYDNQYEHPCEKIQHLLNEQGIPIMTTKTGDIIVESTGSHTGAFTAINLKANSTEVSSRKNFQSKKSKLVTYNDDTLRNLYGPKPAYRRL